MISTIRHSEKGNTVETVERQVVARGKGRRYEAQMIHRAVKLFCNTIMVETWQYALVKSQRNKKSEPSYKLSMSTKSLQSCPTLCTPMDCSPPGSSVHGILQARILEGVFPSSRGSNRPRGLTSISYISCIRRQVLYQ